MYLELQNNLEKSEPFNKCLILVYFHVIYHDVLMSFNHMIYEPYESLHNLPLV